MQIGPLTLRPMGLMTAVAFLVGWALISKELRRKGMDPTLSSSMVTAAAIGGILGAKIYFLIEHWREVVQMPLEMIFSGAGLVWYGGLLGGAIAVLWVARRRGVPLGAVADVLTPALALGYVFGRIGCFLNGEDYGKVTTVPWAMSFPQGAPPTTELVHPTQLYEAAFFLGIFVLLWRWRRRAHSNGWLFWSYLVLAGIERFVVEFWRVTTVLFGGVTVAQMISLALVITGVTGLTVLKRSMSPVSVSKEVIRSSSERAGKPSGR